jgi:hypothetical protein
MSWIASFGELVGVVALSYTTMRPRFVLLFGRRCSDLYRGLQQHHQLYHRTMS